MSETDHISDIGMIMGTNYFHLVPERDVIYGKTDKPSMYSETPIGVVLYGEIQQILPNLHYLDNHNNFYIAAAPTKLAEPVQEGGNCANNDEFSPQSSEERSSTALGGINSKQDDFFMH